VEGVEVTGFETVGRHVERVDTSAGHLACELVVLAPGPWARDLWRRLDPQPPVSFHYWQVREGEYEHTSAALDPSSPVVHLDADVAVSEHLPSHWGIYFRPGLGRGVAAGGLPVALDPECELDPYGPSHPELGATDTAFDESTATALAWALGRFDGDAIAWRSTSGAAQTCFTPDSYPVVDFLADNVYAVFDSNHGFKLLALGELAAAEILGAHVPELDGFRLARFAAAELHPVSASPYPWT
jgi:glycine/D-amino acid oxidase-like deaminating enzyme